MRGASGVDTGPYAAPVPVVPLQSCPIAATLGTLGRKWTLTILRDIAFEPGASFTQMLRSNAGLRPRTLSLRLGQLSRDGLIQRSSPSTGRRRANYYLTEKGREVWPILAGLVQFGVRNFPERVFADGRARNIEDVFPESARLMIGPLTNFARSAAGSGQIPGNEAARPPTPGPGPVGPEPMGLTPRRSARPAPPRPAPRRPPRASTRG
jgi:DNA-binding HxlR family transcriptional regulator